MLLLQKVLSKQRFFAFGIIVSLVLLEVCCECWPVCPTYTLLQSGHASLYTPLFRNLS